MVFQKEESSSMLCFLRNLISKDSRDNKDSCKDCGDIEQGVRTASVADTERAYDIADALEGGLARETTSGFQHPLRRAKNLWKFKVVRSEDKLQYRLFSGNGDFLMYAKASLERRQILFFMYDPCDRQDKGLFDSSRPAFTMNFNEERTEWQLLEERCEHCHYAPNRFQCACRGKRQVACVRHSQEEVGDGLFNCMDIECPGLCADGRPAVSCLAVGGHMPEVQTLTTKRPQWNDDIESLVLDFKGRKILSSSKNFQLALPGRPHSSVCQYGKIGPNSFGLDFKHPLSVVQAFGISLTTLLWT